MNMENENGRPRAQMQRRPVRRMSPAMQKRRRRVIFLHRLIVALAAAAVLIALIGGGVALAKHFAGTSGDPEQGGSSNAAEGSQSSDSAAAENTSAAETEPEEEKHVLEEIDGITYVDGVMIANKTYALPADYAPQVQPEAQSAVDAMIAAAADDGVTLYVISGYRSYEYQAGLYERYVARSGAEAADTFSARPGHSEHQTGYAFDLNSLDTSFADTKEGKWLAAHCAEYGFIIRYPADKVDITGYIYEPWHVRWLGEELAKKVTDSGLCLEEYFGITSVYAEDAAQ